MRRALLIVLGLAAAVLCVRATRLALLSDEGRILRRLDLMVEAFGDTRADPILRGLAPTFRVEPDGADRSDLRGGLVHLFFTERDPETKRFLLRVELEGEPELRFVPDAARPTAAMELVAVFLRGLDDEADVDWRARFTGTWEQDDDGEWRLVEARHQTLAGGGPPRAGRRR